LQALRERLANSGHNVAPAVILVVLSAELGAKAPVALSTVIESMVAHGSPPVAKAAGAPAGAGAKFTALKIAVAVTMVSAVVMYSLVLRPSKANTSARLAAMLAKKVNVDYRRD